jgi:hypothetical protein
MQKIIMIVLGGNFESVYSGSFQSQFTVILKMRVWILKNYWLTRKHFI